MLRMAEAKETKETKADVVRGGKRENEREQPGKGFDRCYLVTGC